MDKKKNRLVKSFSFLMIIVAGATVGYFAGKWGFRAATELPSTIVIVIALLFIPATLLVIGIHEAGHVLAGLWVNFDFRMYVVGPFMWEKEQGRWRFRWNRNVNIAGGMVVCLPVDTENLGRRFIWYAAGGPMASLLLVVLSYVLYRLILPVEANQAVFLVVSYFFMMLSFLSSIIFLVTAIPMHTSGFSTDGARILRLVRGGDTARFEMLILKLITGSTSGLRPRLFNMDELEEAQELANKLNAPFAVYLHSFFHQAAFDRGDMEIAEQHLQNYINEADAIPEGIRNAVWLDAAFFYAYAKKDVSRALEYWSRFKPAAMISKAQIFATEAAIGYLNNENEMVHSKIEASFSELPNMMDKGVGVALKEKLQSLKDQLQIAM